MTKKVDVAINVYGKPFQTAVTLLSLLRFSGEHINKIFFIKEPKQPGRADFGFLERLIGDKLTVFTPKEWLWINQADKSRFGDEDYRQSLRYQYAWEKTTCDFLYLTHNDVLYKGDIIGTLLDEIGDHIGIGQIGQCWNCPAYAAQVCNGDKYLDYRPNYEELVELAKKFPPARFDYEKVVSKENAWTLPECRLNEWVALINMKIAKPITVPHGECCPFGAMYFDIATQWFREVSLKGYTLKNYDFEKLAKHAWASEVGNGHSALFDKKMYRDSEDIAREVLIRDYNLEPNELIDKKSFFDFRKLIGLK